MSAETLKWLNENTLIGYTDKRGTAWHYRASDQGTEPNHFPGAIPVETVRRRLFDWLPVTAELSADAPAGDRVAVPTHRAILRSDTRAVLGIVSATYQPHEYGEWLIDNVGAIVDADLAIGSAGLLRGGAVAWVQVEMEDTIEVGQTGVKFRPFLTAATSLDRSMASTYQTGAQVVVCDNTLSAAMTEDAQRIKVRHTARSLGQIARVRDALQIVHGTADTFAAEVETLTRQAVTDRQWRDFTLRYTNADPDSKRSLALAKTKIDALDRMWHTDERVSPWKNTGWGVLSAVNTWMHHEAPVRGATRVERNMERAATGGVEQEDRRVLDLLERSLTAV